MSEGKLVERAMTDKERIFAHLIQELASTQLMRGRVADGWNSALYNDASFGGSYVHFAYDQKPVAGDLVLAKTGFVSEWKIGYYVEPLPGNFGGAVIREIGTGRLCNYSNESFVPIRGASGDWLLEGEQYQFFKKVLKAFAKGDEYLYRYGGLRFDGTGAYVRIRECHGGFGRDSHPFEVSVPFGPRVTVKAILAAMRKGGYGTHDFKHAAPARAVEG